MRRIILAIVSTAACLVLLLSLKNRSSLARLAPVPAMTPATTSAPPHSPTPATRPTTSKGRTKAASPGSTGSVAPTTVAGNVVQTIYGPVQVAITVTDRKITAASVPLYPNGSPHDQQINSYALPQLIQETIAADSANISAVSGATYTSQGYVNSLQSAIDKAGL